jgi:hypothetical protein
MSHSLQISMHGPHRAASMPRGSGLR